MTDRYRLVRRGNRYYAVHRQTRERESLGTSSRHTAEKVLAARNESARCASLNLAMGRAYLAAHDPALIDRQWSQVIEEFCQRGKEHTKARRQRAFLSPQFQALRTKRLVETTADDLHTVLRAGGSSTNHFLRCLHNLALGFGWLPAPIIPQKLWPLPLRKSRRGITLDEHTKILQSEKNEERRLYYELLWEIGAAQTDAAILTAENIDWKNEVLTYQRKKTGEWASIRIGPRLRQLLVRLPSVGSLFPRQAKIRESARSAEFCRRCRVTGVKGVSLHSYRYAWAERAKSLGYPVRWAQNALGHNSRAVHLAYARAVVAICPSLESYEPGATLIKPVEPAGETHLAERELPDDRTSRRNSGPTMEAFTTAGSSHAV